MTLSESMRAEWRSTQIHLARRIGSPGGTKFHIREKVKRGWKKTDITKAMTRQQRINAGCPRCGSTSIIDASQSLDCNSCGHSW